MKKMKLFWPIFAFALLIIWPIGATAGHKEVINSHMEIPDEVGGYLHAIQKSNPLLKLEHRGFCPQQHWETACTIWVKWYDPMTGEKLGEAIFMTGDGRIGPMIKFTWPDNTEWHK